PSLHRLAEAYHGAIVEAERAALAATSAWDSALARARERLYITVADPHFRQMLFLSSPSLEALTPAAAGPPPPRNQHARQHELTWIAYLQRVTTKNETISFFGPS